MQDRCSSKVEVEKKLKKVVEIGMGEEGVHRWSSGEEKGPYKPREHTGSWPVNRVPGQVSTAPLYTLATKGY